MNSFSARRWIHSENNAFADEISEILHSKNDGETFTSSYAKYTHSESFTPVNLDKLKKHWLDKDLGRRHAPRYNLNLTVLICNHRKAFRTQSVNISLTGVRIKEILPEEFSHHSFDVILIVENKNQIRNYILFRGRAVSGALRTNRVIFESHATGSEEKFIQLVEDLTPAI